MSTMLRLKYFVSLAENLSFTKAAQECYIVQTAMSRQIAALESELGVQLFVRNTRSVELTEAGKEFYGYAVSVLNDYNRGVQRAQQVARSFDWSLKIGIGPQEHLLLEPLLEDFTKKNPQTSVVVDQMGYRNLQKHFREGSYDIIIAHRRRIPEFDDAQSIEFKGIKWGIIVSEKNPLAQVEKFSRADLNSGEYGPQTFVSMTSVNMEEFETSVNQECPGTGFISANSIPLKYMFVRMNMAIAFMPGFLCRDMPSGIVFKELSDSEIREGQFDFIYRNTASERQAQKMFIRHVKEYMSRDMEMPWSINARL